MVANLKLIEAQARFVLIQYKETYYLPKGDPRKWTRPRLAQYFNVSQSTIDRLIARKTHKGLKL